MNRQERRAELSNKHKPNCHIIKVYEEDGREVRFHATKGKRTYQLDKTNEA